MSSSIIPYQKAKFVYVHVCMDSIQFIFIRHGKFFLEKEKPFLSFVFYSVVASKTSLAERKTFYFLRKIAYK